MKVLEIPMAYGRFKTPPTIPYIVFRDLGKNSFKADNTNYSAKNVYDVEFYFEDKDPEKENEIEEVFIDNKIPFDISEDIYIESENLYQKIYEVVL